MTDTPIVNQPQGNSPVSGGRLRARLRSRRDDRGSTLVEAAIVMPVFILIIFGIFEFSGSIMAKTGTGSAAKAGARMAVITGNAPMADRGILLRMAREGAGIQQDHIDRIVIWHATGPLDNNPATACPSTSTPGCNVYQDPQTPGTGAFARAKLPLALVGFSPTSGNADYYFGCNTTDDAANVAHKIDCGWEPHTRRILEKAPGYTCLSSSDPKCAGTDFVGISVQVTHAYYTGFFGTQTQVVSTTVVAIEPQGYDN